MARGKGRGGRRQGQLGTTYTNRTDLNTNRAPTQPIATTPAKSYGDRTRQESAQRVIPLPGMPPVPLSAGTQRPTEPVTAGISMGAGAGPEAVVPSAGITPDQQITAALRGLYAAYPNSDLARLIQSLGG